MKTIFAARIVSCWVLLMILCSGCCASDTNWPEKIRQSVARIGLESKEEDVLVGMLVLRKAGDEAMFELLKEVNNRQVVSNHLQESRVKKDPNTGEVIGKYLTEVGDVVFGIIQNRIEGQWPLGYLSFRVTDRTSVKKWLQSRAEKSLKEIRVELALAALENVKRTYAHSSSSEARGTIKIFEDRIEKIKNNELPDIVP